jgi:hypothetical protein
LHCIHACNASSASGFQWLHCVVLATQQAVWSPRADPPYPHTSNARHAGTCVAGCRELNHGCGGFSSHALHAECTQHAASCMCESVSPAASDCLRDQRRRSVHVRAIYFRVMLSGCLHRCAQRASTPTSVLLHPHTHNFALEKDIQGGRAPTQPCARSSTLVIFERNVSRTTRLSSRHTRIILYSRLWVGCALRRSPSGVRWTALDASRVW